MPNANIRRFVIRLVSGLVACAALFFVFRRIQLPELLATFRTLRVGWFVLAVLAYGFVFLPASWRWHLALRLTGCALHFRTTAAFTLIGHFFYTIFFGAAGGDVAKSALYARWHRLPFHKILAASSLDRLLGSGGLIAFAGLGLGIAAGHGAFRRLHFFHSEQWTVRALILGLIVAAIGVAALKMNRGESLWSRFARAFLESGRRLLASPGTIFPGLLCGFLVQTGLSATLALNLAAVSHESIRWFEIIWVFPVITILSGLPITVNGLGVRDGAALVLLGWYRISGSQAVAMSLLTLVASLIWGAAGSLILWLERHEHPEPTREPLRLISGESVEPGS